MKRHLQAVTIILLLGLQICVAPLGASGPFGGSTDRADAYLEKGMYLEALGAYQESAAGSEDYDTRAKALVRSADVYAYFLDNYEEALLLYNLVTERFSISPHAANAFFNAGMILYERHRYDEARRRFTEYLQWFPAGERRDTAEFMREACSEPPPQGPPPEKKSTAPLRSHDTIRVLLHEQAQRLTLSSLSAVSVADGGERRIMLRVPAPAALTVVCSGDCLRVNDVPMSGDAVVIVPAGTGMLRVNERAYRGKIMLQRRQEGIMVTNLLPLEEYLYGVVPQEMPARWPLEALKAQAVAARSYARFHGLKNRDRAYDVHATTTSQVYGGLGAEQERTTRAVDATKGECLYYGGQPALAYFHAHSGGMTETAEAVWTAAIPYLASVPDTFSLEAPGYRWEASLSLETIAAGLRAQGMNIARIEDVQTLRHSASGRVQSLRIVHSGGTAEISGNSFRMFVSPETVKSTLFSARREQGGLRLSGKGFGHGVGMSQWGARVMAERGYSYGDILRHYYGEVEIR